MKVLFFHGLEGTPHGSKIQFLRANHIYVMAPLLSRDDFAGDLETAQSAFEELQPDVVVGSSRGGAVAVNIDAKNVPLVLIAPAWRHWGTASSVKRNTTILHSKHDDLVPIAGSRELLANSGLTEDRLVVVGAEHRMSDDAALAALLRAVADAAQKPA